jgi:alginate O-acetyltransferase complex protein AlgI
MVFDSLKYLVFLPTVLLIYHFLPKLVAESARSRLRGLIILSASLYFYGSWNYRYVVLLVGSMVLDYFVGRGIEASQGKIRRRLWLLLSLCGNFGALLFFKYYNFFADTFMALGVPGVKLSNFLLPVGISFYSFQTACYSIDVYMGRLKAERNFLNFALYVAYFPQLVAGPIERPGHLLPQIRKRLELQKANVIEGGQLIFWGLFKKIVISNRASQTASGAFAEYQTASMLKLFIGAYAFAIQIYADFSGYSDIAIGTAKILGVDLMKNFNRPYSATSLRDFWRRWHISLSTWFRDYVYIPLGGNRRHATFNLFVVFLVSGIWHGANWTFVVWGLWHFCFLVLEQLLENVPTLHRVAEKKMSRFWRQVITFHIALLGWVFFRADSIHVAFGYLARMLGFIRTRGGIVERVNLVEMLILVGTYWFMDRVEANRVTLAKEEFNWSLRNPRIQLAVWAMIVYLGVFQGDVFIYFQF